MKLVLFILLVGFSNLTFANDFSHFQKILDQHLKVMELNTGGLQTALDYQDLHDNSKSMLALKEQSKVLKEFDIKSLKTKEQATAFWINSYNFFMIQIIIEKGFKNGKLNISSVKDLGNFFNRYRIFKKKINHIGANSYSLDDIEKGILLGQAYKTKGWKDARIHFAVNCASVGCPPLVKDVYTAENLNKTLDSNIEKALKTSRHMRIEGERLHLTHLFKWYKTDFEENSGSVKKFILKYVQDMDRVKAIRNAKNKVYIEYDWKLNKPENFSQLTKS